MTISECPVLPGSVSVALSNIDLEGASPDNLYDRLSPLADAMLEATTDFEPFAPCDIFALFDAFPPVPNEIADAIETALHAAHERARRAIPIMITFARSRQRHLPFLIRGLYHLSFEAGKADDDESDWEDEAISAIYIGMQLPFGPEPEYFDRAMSILSRGFEAGKRKGGHIERPLHGASKMEPRPLDLAARALVLEHEAASEGDHQLSATLKRHRLGMESSVAATSLPQPVDLWQRYRAPDLPLGVLPAVIEAFAREHGGIMGADPAGLAMSALCVCAAAVPDAIKLQVKRHDPTWRESTRLWVGLVGLPSTKKSPIISAALAPLRRADKTLMDHYMAEKMVWSALPDKMRNSTPKPSMRRHIVEDATIEALQVVLADSPNGILSAQDELSGWFGAMDKYSPGKGAQADRAFWLRAFNGGTYNVDRVVRGASALPNLSINLLGGIQPEPLLKLANDAVDDGLIQRFLPVVLQSSTIGRDVPTGDAVAAYERLVGRLIKLRARESGGLSPEPQPLHFSNSARTVRERLERENVELVSALEIVSPKLSAHFGKHDGIFARLCLLWHCIETDGEQPNPEIGEETAERVARFMSEYVRPSAVAFYAGLLGMTAGHEELMGLASYIVSEGLSEVSARDVQRSTRALRHFDADQARRICERLVAFGWLEPMEPKQKSNTSRWRVVPAAHDLFKERGRLESERRAAGREAIKLALGG